MFKIGRYGIAFGRVLRLQAEVPTKVRHFLWFWFLKEARSTDVDKKQEFPLGFPGTTMIEDGRRYRYFKAEKGYKAGQVVMEGDNGRNHATQPPEG